MRVPIWTCFCWGFFPPLLLQLHFCSPMQTHPKKCCIRGGLWGCVPAKLSGRLCLGNLHMTPKQPLLTALQVHAPNHCITYLFVVRWWHNSLASFLETVTAFLLELPRRICLGQRPKAERFNHLVEHDGRLGLSRGGNRKYWAKGNIKFILCSSCKISMKKISLGAGYSIITCYKIFHLLKHAVLAFVRDRTLGWVNPWSDPA